MVGKLVEEVDVGFRQIAQTFLCNMDNCNPVPGILQAKREGLEKAFFLESVLAGKNSGLSSSLMSLYDDVRDLILARRAGGSIKDIQDHLQELAWSIIVGAEVVGRAHDHPRGRYDALGEAVSEWVKMHGTSIAEFCRVLAGQRVLPAYQSAPLTDRPSVEHLP